MKKNQGITLISLIVYIIVMLIAISLITMITTSMTKNLGTVEKASKSATKISKFDMYFLSDIKKQGVSIYDTKSEEYIILEDSYGNIIQYVFENNVIYRIDENNDSQIQICNNITTFQVIQDELGVINVIIGNDEYSSQKSYKIGKW